jgi:CelD/BcsL family acetyltransferase involved in cellulose biosynthesis
MTCVEEINDIGQLAAYRAAWHALLAETSGASFFHSLEWLEVYWRHFGAGQRLRTLLVSQRGRPVGIVPLVVRRERTKVGWLRVLTYPLHDWGSFFGPVGPDLFATLAPALDYIRHTARDWDLLELRWLGGAGTETAETQRAMRSAELQAYATVWNRTAVVDLSGTWEAYFAARPRAWRRNFRHCEKRLAAQGEISYVRYRPRGSAHGQADPRWDLYDACEEIARHSWQGSAANGTTLSHESVRQFLREAHAAAAAAGAVDLNLLLLDGRPAAFVYNYHWRGYVYGLRLGFDADQSRDGAGTVLMGRCVEDSFARGDRLFDLGVGSLDCKRHLRTRLTDIFRLSHFHTAALRAQLLRVKRWAESRSVAPRSIAVGRVQDGTADAR